MSYIVTIEKQSDGTYIAYNKELEGTIIGIGSTVAEAKEDYLNTISEVIEVYNEEKRDLSELLKSKPTFKFDLSSLFDYYSAINIAGFAKFVGINATLLRQYKQGNTYISEKQLQKIEDGIHKLGDELSSLKLV